MEISGEKMDQAWVFAIGGRLDAQSAGQAEASVRQWLAEGSSRLVGDLSKLDYISSAGLRVMLVAAKAVKATGGGICLFGLKAPVRAVFDIAGFSAIIPILDDRAAALAWVAALA
jgi:stage II sporulation protein AA (anti-sigma F factor antagonist)